MNKLELQRKRKNTYNKYHIPGCSALHRVKQNVIFTSKANSDLHELLKAATGIILKKRGEIIITEAVENDTDLRRDLVSLDSGRIFEIETNPKRAERFLGDDPKSDKITIIKAWTNKEIMACVEKIIKFVEKEMEV